MLDNLSIHFYRRQYDIISYSILTLVTLTLEACQTVSYSFDMKRASHHSEYYASLDIGDTTKHTSSRENVNLYTSL